MRPESRLTGWLLALFACHALLGSTGSVIAADGPSPDIEQPLPPAAVLRIGTSRFRTDDFITDLAWSPDGALIASSPANSDNSIRLWDARTGRLVRNLLPKDDTFRPGIVTFSPDGTFLVCGGLYDGVVSIWNLETGAPIFHETLHPGGVQDIEFAPAGGFFATSGNDGRVSVRSVDEPMKEVAAFQAVEAKPGLAEIGGLDFGNGPSIAIAFFPDGERLAIMKSYDEIVVWNRKMDEVERTIHQTRPVGASDVGVKVLAVSPDGERLVTSGHKLVKRESTPQKTGPKNIQMCMVRTWDLRTGQLIYDFSSDIEAYGFGLADVSFLRDEITVSSFGGLKSWNLTTGGDSRSIDLNGYWSGPVKFSPDGTKIATPVASHAIGIFDATTGERLNGRPEWPDAGPESLAWSADGERIAGGYRDGFIRVWNSRTGDLIWREEFAHASLFGWLGIAGHVQFSPDGARLIASGRRDDPIEYKTGLIRVFDAASGKSLGEMPAGADIRTAALSPDGGRLYAGESSGGIHDTRITVHDLTTKQLLMTIVPPNSPGFWQPDAIWFSDEGRTMIVADGDSMIRFFETGSGQQVRELNLDWRSSEQKAMNRPSYAHLGAALLLKEGQEILAAGPNVMTVWNLATGERVRDIPATALTSHLVLFNDSKTAISMDLEGENVYRRVLRVRNIENGEIGPEINTGGIPSENFALSPDGSRVAIGNSRGDLLIFDVAGLQSDWAEETQDSSRR